MLIDFRGRGRERVTYGRERQTSIGCLPRASRWAWAGNPAGYPRCSTEPPGQGSVNIFNFKEKLSRRERDMCFDLFRRKRLRGEKMPDTKRKVLSWVKHSATLFSLRQNWSISRTRAYNFQVSLSRPGLNAAGPCCCLKKSLGVLGVAASGGAAGGGDEERAKGRCVGKAGVAG